MRSLNSRKLNKNTPLLLLHDLLRCAKLLGVSEPKFSEDITMKEMHQELRKHILNEVHPYKIYQSGRDKRWYTYVYDPSYPKSESSSNDLPMIFCVRH